VNIRALVLNTVMACLVIGTAAAASEYVTSERRLSQVVSSLFNMPADTFFALERAGLPIDAQNADHTLMAAALFHETNLRRRENGKPPLDHDPRLDAAARMHATSMARHNYVSHLDPDRPERRTPQDRALLAGFNPRYLAENVATHFDIRYEAGKMLYQVPEGSGFSYHPDGPPIPRHTYRSFASSLLAQWMNSPEHRHNILADQPELFGADCRSRQEAAGIYIFHCVQLFGSPRD
jgi:uncharacterized protein YkwD